MGTAASVVDPLEVGSARHAEGVRRLVDSFHAVPEGEPVRLSKSTSNLFRPRPSSSSPGLDTSGLTRVISVDPDARTADVQGMCTYEDLVDATLAHGLMPYVVPQLKTITLGGAVTGLGIESSSFRLGLPHESVLEMDVLTGTGEIVTARPDGTERERTLFRGFPNSYGSLGYAVRLRIALEPVRRYVELRHVRFNSIAALTAALERISEEGRYDDDAAAATGSGGPGPDADRGTVDFLDGVVFSADESYLTLGRRTDEPGPVSDYSGVADKQAIYYRSIQHDGPDGTVKRPADHPLPVALDSAGSGARGRSVCRIRGSGVSGHNSCCVRRRTGKSSAWITATTWATRSARSRARGRANAWCRTSR